MKVELNRLWTPFMFTSRVCVWWMCTDELIRLKITRARKKRADRRSEREREEKRKCEMRDEAVNGYRRFSMRLYWFIFRAFLPIIIKYYAVLLFAIDAIFHLCTRLSRAGRRMYGDEKYETERSTRSEFIISRWASASRQQVSTALHINTLYCYAAELHQTTTRIEKGKRENGNEKLHDCSFTVDCVYNMQSDRELRKIYLQFQSEMAIKAISRHLIEFPALLWDSFCARQWEHCTATFNFQIECGNGLSSFLLHEIQKWNFAIWCKQLITYESHVNFARWLQNWKKFYFRAFLLWTQFEPTWRI